MPSEHEIFITVKRYICGGWISVSYGKLSNVMEAIARAETWDCRFRCNFPLSCQLSKCFDNNLDLHAVTIRKNCSLNNVLKNPCCHFDGRCQSVMDCVLHPWSPDLLSSPAQSSVYLIVSPGKGVLEMVQVCLLWPHFSFLPRLNKSPDLTLVPASTPCSPRLNTSTARWACSSAKLHGKVCATIMLRRDGLAVNTVTHFVFIWFDFFRPPSTL